MNYEKVLARLCSQRAPSGFEKEISQEAAKLLRPLVDEVEVDQVGNVIGVLRCGKKNAPKLLLDAHLDEIGLIVTGHKEGFLQFSPIGGVDARMLLDREVVILTNPAIHGIVTCLPPHIQSAKDMETVTQVDDLFIDVGLPQEEAVKRIPNGTPIVYDADCRPLGTEMFCGKSLDDRSCFAIMLDTAEQLHNKPLDVDVYFLGSTQEEYRGLGAITATFRLHPDFCVAVDVTHGDSPDAPAEKTTRIGGGPVIVTGPNCSRWMVHRMKEQATLQKIAYQIEVIPGCTFTNGWYMQVSQEGIATTLLSLPLRYMHSPIEVISRSDLTNTANLLTAFVSGLGKEAADHA